MEIAERGQLQQITNFSLIFGRQKLEQFDKGRRVSKVSYRNLRKVGKDDIGKQ